MSHVVIYSGADGQLVHHQVEGVDDAVRHVEQLRNAGQGSDARVFRMVEVPIEVKTYYRVEVAAAPPAPAPVPEAGVPGVADPSVSPAVPVAAQPAPPSIAAVAPVGPAPAAPAPVKGEPVTASNGGRFGLFGKG